MKLLSVNVSKPREVPYRGRIVMTGIFKTAVSGRIMLRKMNLDGDGQADLTVHGGIYKAVYVYSSGHYDFWKAELGRDDFTWGQFGENFTVEGMLEDEVHIGDRFGVGGARVEVTQPRVPCFKFALKMGLPDFPKRFMASGRCGFYLRVLQEGEVGAGDRIERLSIDPARLTIRQTLTLAFFDKKNLEGARKAFGVAALSPEWKTLFEKILGKAR
jgi:MOSC domain-containing protein YiiM